MPPGECARTKKRFLGLLSGESPFMGIEHARAAERARAAGRGAGGAGRVSSVQGHPSRGGGDGGTARFAQNERATRI